MIGNNSNQTSSTPPLTGEEISIAVHTCYEPVCPLGFG